MLLYDFGWLFFKGLEGCRSRLSMLTFNFKCWIAWFFKPFNYLRSDIFNFLFGVSTSDGAFPNSTYTPALFLVIFKVFGITGFVACKLLFPECCIWFWENKILTIFMSMPETAVYENYCIVFWKNKVWFSRISFVTDTISKASFE